MASDFCLCSHTYIHTYMTARDHTCMHTWLLEDTHTHMAVGGHTYIHTYMDAGGYSAKGEPSPFRATEDWSGVSYLCSCAHPRFLRGVGHTGLRGKAQGIMGAEPHCCHFLNGTLRLDQRPLWFPWSLKVDCQFLLGFRERLMNTLRLLLCGLSQSRFRFLQPNALQWLGHREILGRLGMEGRAPFQCEGDTR